MCRSLPLVPLLPLPFNWFVYKKVSRIGHDVNRTFLSTYLLFLLHLADTLAVFSQKSLRYLYRAIVAPFSSFIRLRNVLQRTL